MQEQTIHWEDSGLTRVPYAVYGGQALVQQEQERIFQGSTWNYLCLEAELPEAGSFRTTFVGETPVVVVKDVVRIVVPCWRLSGPAKCRISSASTMPGRTTAKATWWASRSSGA